VDYKDLAKMANQYHEAIRGQLWKICYDASLLPGDSMVPVTRVATEKLCQSAEELEKCFVKIETVSKKNPAGSNTIFGPMKRMIEIINNQVGMLKDFIPDEIGRKNPKSVGYDYSQIKNRMVPVNVLDDSFTFENKNDEFQVSGLHTYVVITQFMIKLILNNFF